MNATATGQGFEPVTPLLADDAAHTLSALKRLLRSPGYCLFTADAGAEIALETLQRIFEPFFATPSVQGEMSA